MIRRNHMNELLDEIGAEEYERIYKALYDLECLGCLIYRADRIMVNRLNRAFQEAGFNITLEQFRVLLHMWEEDGQLQSHLVEQLGKDKGGMARTLDIMEKKHNLIVRISSKADKRQRRVYLSNKGKELKSTLAPIAVRENLEYFDMIGPENVEIARRILKQLLEKL